MNLNCPKCQGEDTRKLTLVMSRGGTTEKGAQLGAAYFLNIVLPILTLFFSFLISLLFGMIFNGFVALIAFGGLVFAGFTVRKKLRARTRSPFADLPAHMKQNGFLCNRCEHVFVPAG